MLSDSFHMLNKLLDVKIKLTLPNVGLFQFLLGKLEELPDG
jgi:hypothetical protein